MYFTLRQFSNIKKKERKILHTFFQRKNIETKKCEKIRHTLNNFFTHTHILNTHTICIFSIYEYVGDGVVFFICVRDYQNNFLFHCFFIFFFSRKRKEKHFSYFLNIFYVRYLYNLTMKPIPIYIYVNRNCVKCYI